MREETLGQLIKAARMKRKWAQWQLAEAMKKEPISIGRWERDENIPHPDTLAELIRILSLDKKTAVRLARIQAAKQARAHASLVSEPVYEWADYLSLLDTFKEDDALSVIEVTIPPPQKIYRGVRTREPYSWDGKTFMEEKVRVTVDGKPLFFYDTSHFEFGSAHPDERKMYEWGYTGAGPRHLACSILADYFSERGPVARWERGQTGKYYYQFKMEFVAWFPREGWELHSAAITAWLQEREEMGEAAPQWELSDVDKGWRGWSERWQKYKNPTTL